MSIAQQSIIVDNGIIIMQTHNLIQEVSLAYAT